MPKSQVLNSELKIERVRDDESGHGEYGEDDELPCVIGESEGDDNDNVVDDDNENNNNTLMAIRQLWNRCFTI